MNSTEEATVYQGRVKWFNNKAGYGFITVIDSDDNTIPEDVFAHHSAICVSDEQYKYLVQGEYVQFTLSTMKNSDNHKYQAGDIKGMKGGKLLCETRNENRSTAPPRRNTESRGNRKERPRGAGPREKDENGGWILDTGSSGGNRNRRDNSSKQSDKA
jgi:cold shock CspA family protein